MGYPEAQYVVDEVNSHVSDVGNEIKTNATNNANNIIAKIPANGGVQTFTSNGTFTVPAGVKKILVTACGGGGGGGIGGISSDSYLGGHGGNGAECIVKRAYPVTPGQKISITIGSGGKAGKINDEIGGAGGNTVIGNLVTLLGGCAGQAYHTASHRKFYYREDRRIGGGYGGNYSLDDAGQPGENGAVGLGGLPGGSKYSGCGGGGSLGNGGNGAYGGSSSGASASTPGYGGGGGGGHGRYTVYAASAGGKGIVIIEW